MLDYPLSRHALRLLYLAGCHSLGKLVTNFAWILKAGSCGQANPHICPCKIQRNTHTFCIHLAKV